MRRERVKQSFKLRLLALVLALALLWYSLNPAPGRVERVERDDEVPDGKKREAEPSLLGGAAFPGLLTMPGQRPSDEVVLKWDEDDDFDWPEFIDG
ncbi:MAG TPA: hypothetical protein VF544_20825 [Pyrinomonadaceae bacterium]|jgi:hypothetical protein